MPQMFADFECVFDRPALGPAEPPRRGAAFPAAARLERVDLGITKKENMVGQSAHITIDAIAEPTWLISAGADHVIGAVHPDRRPQQ
jgi:hypothetical protein